MANTVDAMQSLMESDISKEYKLYKREVSAGGGRGGSISRGPIAYRGV